MRLLNKYILSEFVTTFIITLVVVTFIMSLGAVFQITDLLARHVSWKPIVFIFATAIPMALAFSIPVSAVTASLLVFERMSGDGEIAAMKSCGVSIWQIASRPMLFAALLSGICLYINTDLVATCHYLHRKTIAEHREELTRSMWEPGRFVLALPGLAIRVGENIYDPTSRVHNVRDVIIYDNRNSGKTQEYRATDGRIETDLGNGELHIQLSGKVRIDPAFPGSSDIIGMTNLNFIIDTNTIRQAEYRKRMADLTASELVEDIVSAQTDSAYGMALAVELNQRIVLGLSCISFVLLGIGFGVTSRRASSTKGIAISLLIVFSYYLCVVLVDSLARRPEARPDLIMWVPAAVSVAIGILMLRRIQ